MANGLTEHKRASLDDFGSNKRHLLSFDNITHMKMCGYLVNLSYVHLRGKENPPPSKCTQSERTSSCFMHAAAAATSDNGVVK